MHFASRDSYLVKNYVLVRMAMECMCGISMFIAFEIYAQVKQVQFSKRLGFFLLGFCILGLHYYSVTPGMFDSETIFLSRYLLFVACFHLLVSVAAFHHVNDILAFWQYNYFLLTRMITSVAYSLTLFLGLATALWAIDTLFNIQINFNYYIDLLLLIFMIFNTIFFLMGIPADYSIFKNQTDFKKAIRIFVQYILLPIIGLYILILYFYAGKILLNKAMPEGWVCIPILIFSIIGILAYVLTYPIRKDEHNRIIYVYARYFFYILLPLLSLYFIAIIKRIMPYGITEDRYLVLVLGIWLVIISVYIIVSKRDNIIVIPGSLFVLLALSTMGPWGMYQLSIQNQVVRLEHLLKRNQLLQNGKLVSQNTQTKVDKKDAASIRSILFYLNKRGSIDRIHRWLGEEDQQKLLDAINKNETYSIHAIFSSLELDYEQPFELTYLFQPSRPFVTDQGIDISSYQYLYAFTAKSEPVDQLPVFPMDSMVHARILGDHLYLMLRQDTLFQSRLNLKLLEFVHEQKMKDSIDMKQGGLKSAIKVINTGEMNILLENDRMLISDSLHRLFLNRFEVKKYDTIYRIESVQGYIAY
ncbi:MAG: DUF4153 domain-containing protein [Chitinophagaceae bacterium]|nr:DUF4153 domain-containing protein [Chitinophagaceae bacterium]